MMGWNGGESGWLAGWLFDGLILEIALQSLARTRTQGGPREEAEAGTGLDSVRVRLCLAYENTAIFRADEEA